MTRLSLLILPAALLLIGAGPAADSPAERMATAERAARQAAARARQLDKGALAAVDAAERARAEIAALAGQVQAAEAAVAAAEARTAVIKTQLRAARARLAAKQGRLIDLTAALQTLSRRPPALALVQPGQITKTARVSLLLDGVMPAVRARTAGARTEIAALQTLRDRAQAAEHRLLAAHDALDGRRRMLAAAEIAQRRQARALATRALFESDRTLALATEARDLKDLQQELLQQQRLRERLASLPGPLPRPRVPNYALPPPDAVLPVKASASVAAPAGLAFRMPAIGDIVAGFGALSDAGVRARGITLATRDKAQVVAPADGRVAFAGDFKTYGKIVIIEHEGGWTTLVTGLDDLDVEPGEKVSAGSPLGRMGKHGGELIVELRQNGTPVDPLPLMLAGA